MQGFSWGHAFFEVNGGLLEKYAQCQDAEEVGKVQDAWLARLEREWAESREDKGDEDEWAGGNPNRREESEDEDESEKNEEEDDDTEGDEEEKEDEKHEDGIPRTKNQQDTGAKGLNEK